MEGKRINIYRSFPIHSIPPQSRQKISQFLGDLYRRLEEASRRPDEWDHYLQVFRRFEAALGALLVWVGARKSCFPVWDYRHGEVCQFIRLLNNISGEMRNSLHSVESLAFLALQYRSASGSTSDCYMITRESSQVLNQGHEWVINDAIIGAELELSPANIRDFANSSTRLPNAFIIFEKRTNASLFVELFSRLSKEEWDEFVAVCDDRVELWNMVTKAFDLPCAVAGRWEVKQKMPSRL